MRSLSISQKLMSMMSISILKNQKEKIKDISLRQKTF